MYAFALGFIKVSVLFQLLRIAARKSTYRKVIFGVFGVSIVFSVASVILAVLQCVPITYVWERMDPELGATGTCMEYFTSTVASSAMTVVMDMLIVSSLTKPLNLL